MFLHYCGGELEKVNFVIKGASNCCGEDETSEPMDDGCCKDENILIKDNTHFTFKQQINTDFVKSFCDVFYTSLHFIDEKLNINYKLNILSIEAPPPKLQASLVISTSVLRI
ncbi:MAG: hypothetical protein WCH21_02660 [Bacteroidota bacterium]